MFNLAAALLDPNLAAGRASRPAFRVRGATLSYSDVAHLAARASNGLRARGVAPGDRVALVLPDSPAFVATFLGALRIGAIAVTLSTYLSRDEYAYALDDCGARLTITDAAAGAALSAPAIEFTDLVAAKPDSVETHPTRAEDPAFIQYSSGTTGKPKGVVHLHRNGVQPAKLHGRHVSEITDRDVVFSIPRQFFSFGLNNSLLVPLYYGACAILEAERPSPDTKLNRRGHVTGHGPAKNTVKAEKPAPEPTAEAPSAEASDAPAEASDAPAEETEAPAEESA